MKKSLLSALGLAFALTVSMPVLGASIANAAMQQAPGATTTTTTSPGTTSPGSDAMTTKHVKKHVKRHKRHVTKHTMAKKAY
jgi:hypothetical protein